LTLTYATVPKRLAKQGDPWKDSGKIRQRLEEAIRAAAKT